MSNLSKIQDLELLKWSKWQFLTFLNQLKLISRKIITARKIIELPHCNSQLGYPGMYLDNFGVFRFEALYRMMVMSTIESICGFIVRPSLAAANPLPRKNSSK